MHLSLLKYMSGVSKLKNNRFKTMVTCIIMIFITVLPIVESQSDYPTYVFGFIELRLVPEPTDSLLSSVPLFGSDQQLASLLESDDFLFWEPIGHSDANFDVNNSMSSFALVFVNETGVSETIVALSPDNLTLLWVQRVQNLTIDDFIIVLNSTIQFFTGQGKYWGLCEEIVLLPGAFIESENQRVWRFQYLLTENSERWTLYVDTVGQIIDSEMEGIPCQSCTFCTLLVILCISASIIAIIIVILIFRKRGKTN